ncbi:nuclear transport factor 2 family protein [Streptomyces griseocarneus]|uniref:nuclear transport factor 2 family protein n=1 Tax=Streptomyces griseocarneus TaxID=51201 RepID=UPI00167D1B28|nr:nuclear transport factor 2 family protein [Streptomyces griseocarneus]MBZ6474592.1 nuclear transport factor 2 family protein [Streptomyces griseocarneus]
MEPQQKNSAPETSALRALTDRAGIERLVTDYLRSLDERAFGDDWARSFFTEDASTRTPVGTHEGAEAQLTSTRDAMALFERTVHFGSNIAVDLHGDRATVRWNQLSTHVLGAPERLFESGGHVEAEAVRTPDGWRLRRMALHIVWTKGEPPVLPRRP